MTTTTKKTKDSTIPETADASAARELRAAIAAFNADVPNRTENLPADERSLQRIAETGREFTRQVRGYLLETKFAFADLPKDVRAIEADVERYVKLATAKQTITVAGEQFDAPGIQTDGVRALLFTRGGDLIAQLDRYVETAREREVKRAARNEAQIDALEAAMRNPAFSGLLLAWDWIRSSADPRIANSTAVHGIAEACEHGMRLFCHEGIAPDELTKTLNVHELRHTIVGLRKRSEMSGDPSLSLLDYAGTLIATARKKTAA